MSSQRAEPIEERGVISPDRLSWDRAHHLGRRLAGAQRRLLGPNRDLRVAVGRLQVGVTEPGADDVRLNAGFEKMDGGGVAKDVRCDPAPADSRRPSFDGACMAAYDSVDADARERTLPEGREDRCIRRCAAIEEHAEEPDCLAPEGAGPPVLPAPATARAQPRDQGRQRGGQRPPGLVHRCCRGTESRHDLATPSVRARARARATRRSRLARGTVFGWR